MKLAALFSGGEDSVAAIWKAIEEGHEVKYLISVVSDNSSDSYIFHYPNIELALVQSMAMDIKLVTKGTKGIKEKELKDLENIISSVMYPKNTARKFSKTSMKSEIDGIVVGALASKYQRDRIKKICNKLGLELIAPYWGKDAEQYWNELIDNGFKIMITKVACDGLGKEWLGRVIDKRNLAKLKQLADKYKFHLAFEGGEAETFVLDCPIFKKKIKITKAKTEWKEDSGIYRIEKVHMDDK